MDKPSKKSMEIFAKDDAQWDNCFEAVNRAQIVKNHSIRVYDPPKDPEEKKIYDRCWKKAKGEKN